jgi:glycosyltransferase involved in cell wall biosynthesis
MGRTKGKIFVLMSTYNHRQFLEAAVEGVMSQVVDVPVLLIIRDDASTDGTRELAEKLARRFPGRIELILNEKNLFQASPGAVTEILREILLRGGRFAAKSWLGRLRTKHAAFIALCEGDDFWTDPQKLQKQLEVFRKSPLVRLVHHDVEMVVEGGGSRKYAESLRNYLNTFDSHHPNENDWFFRDGHNVMTCSAMLRASAVDDGILMGRPPGLAGDWIIFALIARETRPHFITERMATYRIHANSFWSSMKEEDRAKASSSTKEFLDFTLVARGVGRKTQWYAGRNPKFPILGWRK